MKKQILKSIAIFIWMFLTLSGFAQSQCVQCDPNSSANGNYSSVLGMSAVAEGQASFASGLEATSLGNYSIALGKYVTSDGASSVTIGRYLEAIGSPAMVIGTGADQSNMLINNIGNSLMIGFSSNKPTLFIGKAPGNGYTGSIGIGDITTPQAKLHIKADDNEAAALFIEPHQWGGSYAAYLRLGTPDYGLVAAYQRLEFKTVGKYVFNDGNIGVGTYFPTEKLDVNGNIKQTEGFYLGTDKVQAVGENGLRLYNYNQQGILINPGGNVAIGTGSALHKLTVNGNIFTSSNAYIAGNTGIGTVTPQEKLHVEGNQYLSGNLTVHGSSNLNGIVLNNDTDISGADEIIGYNDLRLKGDANGGTDVLITADGKLGIGTGAPTAHVQINDATNNANEDFILVSNLDVFGSGTTSVGKMAGHGPSITQKAGNVNFSNSGPSLTFMQKSWNEEVGFLVRTYTDLDGGVSYTDMIAPSGDLFIRSGGKMVFRTDEGSEGEVMRLTADGRVGIGTGTPSEILEVNGNIKAGTIIANSIDIDDCTFNTLTVTEKLWAGEIEVTNLTEWKDNVFEEGYDLKSLKEVENYIRLNGHLPDIPSENEVLENGINVGEMNALLLQKIEELTLYVIELEKKINNFTEE